MTAVAASAEPSPSRRPTPRRIARVGGAAGLGAGAVMGGWLMYVGEVAAEPTAVPGVRSSTWTALTSLTSLVFGLDAFHAEFAALSILFGLAVHVLAAVAFGLLGIGLLVYTVGERPSAPAAAGFGFVHGLLLQVVVVNLVVNALQDPNVVYEAIPQWGWWVGTAAWGVAYGLLAARGLGRAA